MATLTAGNFYWAGYKPLGPNTNYRYRRGNTFHGNTGYDWAEVGNWFVKYFGYTGDDSFSEGGYTQGYYFDDAPRVPHEGDSVYFEQLRPDQPGIDGFYPTSECLFGGITGPRTGAGGTFNKGGTWDNGTGTDTQLQGNLELVQVDKDYSQVRGASFALGNEFGATFGQVFMGLSASIDLAGLQGICGSTGTLTIKNWDGTLVKFAGNTSYNFGTTAGTIGTAGDVYGRTGYYIIGTDYEIAGARANGITAHGLTAGNTYASRALFNAFQKAITAGHLKSTISNFANGLATGATAYHGVNTFRLTQVHPGSAGNTKLTGSLVGRAAGVSGGLSANPQIASAITAGNSAEFSGGTDNPTENALIIKTNNLITNGDGPIHFVDTTLTRAFILGASQFNYKRGSINQLIYDRQTMDYIGPPRTSSYILDTELTNSVVISGGTYQHSREYDAQSDTFLVDDDVSGSRPITFIRASGNIEQVEIDAFRHGTVRIEGSATTLNVHPEKEHPKGGVYQGHIDITRPPSFSDRYLYGTIDMKSYNANESISGTTLNTQIALNSGLTISNLNIGAGTVFVGPNISDRPITVVDGSISGRGVLRARSEFNPSYQGFKIGDDFAATAEGMLISDPDARIEFSTGHYVLASFSFGNTGADDAFTKPGTPIPPRGFKS